jgi:ABC-type sulfate transport system permease component
VNFLAREVRSVFRHIAEQLTHSTACLGCKHLDYRRSAFPIR